MLVLSQPRRLLIVLICGWSGGAFWSPNVVVGVSATIQWAIQHSYDGGETYSPRGTLEWKGEEEEGGGLVITNDPLTSELVQNILSMPWYKIKIETTSSSSGNHPEEYVLATVPSCHLRRANFKDEFSLTFPRVGTEEQMISSLSYIPLVSPLAPKTCEEYPSDSSLLDVGSTFRWNSKVTATLDIPGMTVRSVLPKMKAPPGLTWTTKSSGGAAASRGGGTNTNNGGGSGGDPSSTMSGGGGGGPEGEEEGTDQRPFYIKYWYVFVPLLLANLMPAPDNPKQSSSRGPTPPPAGAAAADGGGSAGGGSGSGGGPVVSPPTGDGGAGATKRRGKRG